MQPVDRREHGDDGRWLRGTREHDLTQDRPAIDVQEVEPEEGELYALSR